MGKGRKKKPLQKLANTEPAKTESTKTDTEKQVSASATNVSNPILPEAQSDFPSLQSSVLQTGEATRLETVQKKMSDLKISADFRSRQSSVPPTEGTTPLETVDEKRSGVDIPALATQKNEQQKTGSQSGAKPKTFTYSGGERIGKKVDKFHIYQVPSGQEKVGTLGKKIRLRANHFPMEINVPGGVIYHYDVEFKFSEKNEKEKKKVPEKKEEVKNRKLLLKAFNQFKKKNSQIFVSPHVAVFDGLKNVYTCKKLKFPSKESKAFKGEIEIKEDANSSQDSEITVILKYAGPVDVNDAVAEYCRGGITETKPSSAIQALNIVLSMTPKLHYETVGRNHFSPNLMDGTAIDIGGGASLWVGTFTSVRLGWKPMLNVDVANTVGFDERPVVKFIEKILESNRGYHHSHILLNDKHHFDTVNNKIKDLKICYNVPGPNGYKRNYRVNKMMPAANKLKVKLDSGAECTIEKYFKDKYNLNLDFPHFPCIHVGKPEKTVYLPIELCMMRKQVLPWFKHIDDNQCQKMIRAAAKPPKERRATIERNLKNLSNYYDKDPYANAFGLKVRGEMMKTDGRVLDPPSLKYKGKERNNDVQFGKVNNGKWAPGTIRDKDVLKFLKPMELKYWGVFDMANIPDKVKKQFVDRLIREGNSRGVHVNYPTYFKPNAENLLQVKQAFTKLHDHIKKINGSTQLIMVITARKGPPRGELKYYGDTVFKVPTQFVMKNNVFGKENKGPSDQVFHNICLKINHKLGGVNHALWKRPTIMNRPVMVMGADVTHPAPRDDCRRPSIAAVVGSTDPNVSQFNVEIRLQELVTKDTEGKSKVRVVEEIVKIKEMAYSLLLKFFQITQRKPEQIIYYRDGVSEGQFPAVLNHELSAIRRACVQLEPGYQPKVTFIIAQKRHKTRFFVENPHEGVGKTKNVPAGTVVDTEITTLSEIDFFLASHEGIQVCKFVTFFWLIFLYKNVCVLSYNQDMTLILQVSGDFKQYFSLLNDYGILLSYIFKIPSISNEKPGISIEIPRISIKNLVFRSKY